jgi:hypothetical protein
MMRLFLPVVVCVVILFNRTAVGGDCSVCLGRNLSVASSEHSERLYLTIEDSPPIYFYKPQPPPRIVARGLDRTKRYLVRVHFDGQVVASWHLDFNKLESNMAYIWRAKGSWRMDPGRTEKCTWPPE